MTFYIGLLLVVPETEERKLSSRFSAEERTTTRRMWRIEHTINLSELPNPLEDDFKQLPPKKRAASLLLELIWPSLSHHLDNGPAEFAPRFIMYEDDFAHYPKPDPEFVLPIMTRDEHHLVPSERVMQMHNEVHDSGDQNEFRLRWIRNDELIEMIHRGRAEADGLPEFDEEAKAYFTVWLAMLREFSKLDGRVIVPIHELALLCF